MCLWRGRRTKWEGELAQERPPLVALDRQELQTSFHWSFQTAVWRTEVNASEGGREGGREGGERSRERGERKK